MSDQPDLRLSDAERTEAMDALSEHVRTGRLDIDEFGLRSAKVAAARTRADLVPLFADLPAPRPRVLDRPVAPRAGAEDGSRSPAGADHRGGGVVRADPRDVAGAAGADSDRGRPDLAALMEPVEINAGRYYLRQLRGDDLLDDRPALAAAGVSAPEGYVDRRAREWAGDESYSWAIAEPTTGALLGEVVLGADGALEVWTSPEDGTAAREAADAVARFAAGALGLAVRQP